MNGKDGWLRKVFAQAKKRSEQVPPWARPVYVPKLAEREQ